VSEQLHDSDKIDTTLHEIRGERVTEVVEATLPDTSACQRRAEGACDPQ